MSAPALWFEAVRPRTLVLAVAGVALGVMLAGADGGVRWGTAALTLATAVLLQVLSNLANDYGDSVHGADGQERVGPRRAVQSGRVTREQMLGAVVLSAALAALAGVALVLSALATIGLPAAAAILALGLAALWAAWAYTGSSRPYGYVGLGDAMVFLFFGPVAVLGTYYLQTGAFAAPHLPTAAALGLLATAVLNVNNLRDLEGDRAAGKLTVPVRLGQGGGRTYHLALLAGAPFLALAAALLDWRSPWQLLFLVTLPLLAALQRRVATRAGAALDPLLKGTALAALAFATLVGVGALLASRHDRAAAGLAGGGAAATRPTLDVVRPAADGKALPGAPEYAATSVEG